MKKPKIIIIVGAPGVGKTTVAKILAKRLNGVYMKLSHLRAFHLDPKWKNASRKEANMAYENLVFIAKNYVRHNYTPVIIEDILTTHSQRLKKDFLGLPIFIVNLVMSNQDTQKKRVLTESRDSGYRNWKDALVINRFYQRRKISSVEMKTDTTTISANSAVNKIISALK